MPAPEISAFGDGSHDAGEAGISIDGGGFGAFPGSAWIYANSDRTGAADELTVNAWNDLQINVDIPGALNNSNGTRYLFVQRDDLAWSHGFDFTLANVAEGDVSENPAGGLLLIQAHDRVVKVAKQGYLTNRGQFESEVPQLRKDPLAVLDFVWDWTPWLNDSETITAKTVTVPAGLSLDSDSESSGLVTAWLSGGAAGETNTIVCEITTNQGRTDLRRMVIAVSEWIANSNPFLKDPDAVLDYTWDWNRWLATGETISSRSVTEPAGLTRDSVGDADGFVTAWMSGGTVGSDVQEFPCTITTSAGRTDARRIRISVVER